MIDTEVTRLRRLRNTALRARAVAAALGSDPAARDSAFSEAQQVAADRPRNHRPAPCASLPELQRDPAKCAASMTRQRRLLGAITRYRGRSSKFLRGAAARRS